VVRVFCADFTIPIQFAFSGGFSSDGLGIYGQRDACFTMFQCDYARRVFPCFDEPHVRSTFSLTLRIPDHLTAVSNSPLASRATDGATAVCTFARTIAMPACLCAIAVDRFESVKGATHRGLPVEVFARAGEAGREAVLAESIGAVEFFEGYLGVDLPIAALQIISVPSFKYLGMENFGAIFFDSQFVSAELGLFARDLLVHEIVHQWAGNITSPTDWRELWVSEGWGPAPEAVYGLPELVRTSEAAARPRLRRAAKHASRPARVVQEHRGAVPCAADLRQVRAYPADGAHLARGRRVPGSTESAVPRVLPRKHWTCRPRPYLLRREEL
jgi:hypothetical protein